MTSFNPPYHAPWWLPEGNSQTIWAATYGARGFRHFQGVYHRERWPSPDGDFIDVDWLPSFTQTTGTESKRPLLVLFHGLEGCSKSHYAKAFADWATELGWDYAVPHFRGCSGVLNHAPRAYHSGDFAEIRWLLQRFSEQHQGPLVALGISLGGNALLRYLEVYAQEAAAHIKAAIAVCAPLDLAKSSRALESPFNRLVYTNYFFRRMKPRALARLKDYPDLFDAQAIKAASTLRDFDQAFTAPVHGFGSADNYYAQSSSLTELGAIQTPTLLLNPLNDPFVPAHALPKPEHKHPRLTLWQPQNGGHVGLVNAHGSARKLPDYVGLWLQQYFGLPGTATNNP